MDSIPSILIVDSNAGFARMLKESLEQDGDYEATVAHTGHQALEIASAASFDLAIVDLGIKAVDGLDGETIARRLRHQQTRLRLMLIPVQGDTLPEDLMDLDVQGTLPKPFFLPDLPGLLDAALKKPVEEPREDWEKPGATADAEVEDVEPTRSAPPRDTTPKPVAREPSAEIAAELEHLLLEIRADAVLITRSAEVLTSVGRLDADQLNDLAQIISETRRLSNRTAQILGREQGRFEQSVESDEHMLYSVTIAGDVLVSAVLRRSVTLGLLRHQMKRTARHLYERLEAARV